MKSIGANKSIRFKSHQSYLSQLGVRKNANLGASTPLLTHVKAMQLKWGALYVAVATCDGLKGIVSMVSLKSISIPVPDKGYDLSAIIDFHDENTRNIMVVCHGLLSCKSEGVSSILAGSIKYNICRFDFAGNGDSGGVWSYSAYDRETDDLRSVVDYLRKEGWNVSFILGHSKGTAAVLHYAARYDDIPNVIALSGRFDTTKMPKSRFTDEQWSDLKMTGSMQWKRRGKVYRVFQEDLDNRAALDIPGICATIRRCNFHIIHGDKDSTIPISDATQFHRSIKNSTLCVIPGGSHSFESEERGRQLMVDAVQGLLDSCKY